MGEDVNLNNTDFSIDWIKVQVPIPSHGYGCFHISLHINK